MLRTAVLAACAWRSVQLTLPRRVLLAAPAALALPANAAPSKKADFLQGLPVETDLAPLPSGRRSAATSAVDEPKGSMYAEQVVAAQTRALETARNPESTRVTERVKINVRCARTDGTFSTRVEDQDPPLLGSLTVGLFGEGAPANVALFLTFALGEVFDGPLYTRSLLDEIAENAALIVGGRIRGVDERELFGTEKVLLYRGTEALSPLAESVARAAQREATVSSHDRAGLLTRRRLAEGVDLPEFALTLRAAPELDADWVVFGKLEADDANLIEKIKTLPRYSDVAVGPLAEDNPIAAGVFNTQRKVFKSAARAIGDTRGSGVFPGKILRRVEVTQTTLL